jgi:MoaA/NifB/PqqE/SkfB family radical SAM enzyme
MTITHAHTEMIENGTGGPLATLWVEITGKCQLSCVHCYAGSGPDGTHGTMTVDDWERVITDAAALGTRMVCFIGGEPTLNLNLPRLVCDALDLGMEAEVFSNLVRVAPAMWNGLFGMQGVRLATSWYTSDRLEHEQITGRDTWRQTLGNIKEAVRRKIPLRVGLIDGILPDQHAAEGEELLRALGVTDIGTDRLREFGRGTLPDPSQACGHCGHGRAAVLPDGTVTPCPMTRWMVAGNVRETGLGEIMTSVTSLAATLPARDRTLLSCNPNCVPDSYCNPLCTPGACKPRI